jgi:anti-anti-sigma regulatory factor
MSVIELTTSQIQGEVSATILHIKGHIDRITSERFLDHARQIHEDGATHLLVDLTNVTMLTSSGLLAIQSIFKLFTPEPDLKALHARRQEPYKSPYVKLVCPNSQIYYILNITGFMQNILIYNNMEEAIKSFDR